MAERAHNQLTGEAVLDLVRDYGAIMRREAVAEPGQRKRNVQGEAMVAMQRIVDALARADDVIWVPCRGCTDLAGCEERWECLTLGVAPCDGGQQK